MIGRSRYTVCVSNGVDVVSNIVTIWSIVLEDFFTCCLLDLRVVEFGIVGCVYSINYERIPFFCNIIELVENDV